MFVGIVSLRHVHADENSQLQGTFGLVLIVRFLERAGLERFGSYVAPGGCILHCTFQTEADGTWPHASPKRLDKVRYTIDTVHLQPFVD